MKSFKIKFSTTVLLVFGIQLQAQTDMDGLMMVSRIPDLFSRGDAIVSEHRKPNQSLGPRIGLFGLWVRQSRET